MRHLTDGELDIIREQNHDADADADAERIDLLTAVECVRCGALSPEDAPCCDTCGVLFDQEAILMTTDNLLRFPVPRRTTRLVPVERLTPAEARTELQAHVTTFTISPAQIEDAFYGVLLLLADEVLGREATHAEVCAGSTLPVAPGALMIDIYLSLDLPLPAWAATMLNGPSVA